MAGIGFQKLNGAGTVADNQLSQLKLLNSQMAELKNSFVSPDLKAWFKTLFPGKPIIPYYKTFYFANPVDASVPTPIGKKIYAEVYMSVVLREVASTNNTYVGANLTARLGSEHLYRVAAAVHGNDILQMPAQVGTFTGVLDTLFMEKTGSGSCQADGFVVIRGFEVPDDTVISDLSDMDAEPINPGSSYGGVQYLTVSDLTLGTEFSDPLYAGVTFALYYQQGSQFLVPGTDFEFKPSGGFDLTGFPPLELGQTLILIP